MRELLYLSDAKLAQFDLSPAPRRRPRFRMESQVSVPGVASMKVSPADQAAAEASLLQKVVTAMERSERAPVPIDTPGIAAGQWVKVTRTLSYAAIMDTAVFFLDRDPAPDVLDQEQQRLLLHGSIHHLRAPYQGVRSIMRMLETGASTMHIMDIVRMFARSRLADGELTAEQALAEIEAGFGGSRRRGDPADWQDVSLFVSQLEMFMPAPEVYASMSSLARVTAVVPYYKATAPTEGRWDIEELDRSGTLVIASPLFVEYAAASGGTSKKRRSS